MFKGIHGAEYAAQVEVFTFLNWLKYVEKELKVMMGVIFFRLFLVILLTLIHQLFFVVAKYFNNTYLRNLFNFL